MSYQPPSYQQHSDPSSNPRPVGTTQVATGKVAQVQNEIHETQQLLLKNSMRCEFLTRFCLFLIIFLPAS